MKLLGYKIKRTGSAFTPPSEHVVWAGFARKEVIAHKQFVHREVYNPKYDGRISFEDVESDVIVFEPGMYRCVDGSVVEIQRISGCDCYGYTGHFNKRGKWRRSGAVWFYVNGQAFESRAQKLMERIQ